MHHEKIKNDMEQLDINNILETFNPDKKELASLLFPGNNWPETAFDRIVKGVAKLDSEQIAILADYLGVHVGELYTVEDSKWHGRREPGSDFVLAKQSYKAKYSNGKVSVYKKNSHIGSFVVPTKVIPFKDLISLLDNYINNNN